MRLGFFLFLAVCWMAVPLRASCVDMTIIASLSEQIGEVASMAAVEGKIPNAKQLPSDIPGKGKTGQFDKVYVDGDTVYIVESKGASSDLGTRKDLNGEHSQQGTPEYMDSVISNMKEKIRDGKKDPRYSTDTKFKDQIDSLSRTLTAINKAKATPGKLVYLKASQRVDANGKLMPEVELVKFENSSRKSNQPK